jgi:hypothetical protein
MTIKIKAPKAWEYPNGMVSKQSIWEGERRVRIVRESDWHKLMKLVKAVDDFNRVDDWRRSRWAVVVDALEALEKKK